MGVPFCVCALVGVVAEMVMLHAALYLESVIPGQWRNLNPMTIIFYIVTFLIGFLQISKRLSFMLSAILQFRFLADLIIWGLVVFAWLKVEGGIMPFAAFIMSIVSVAILPEVSKKAIGQERAADLSKTVGREQFAIVTLMVACLIYEHPIRWW